MKNTTVLVLIFSTLLCLLACGKTATIEPNSDFLNGLWIEKESEEIIHFGGTNYTIEFSGNDFFLKRIYWTDALDPDNDCVNGHTIYYKGTVTVTDTELQFDGQHTDADFELTDPVCDRSTTYSEAFEYKKESDTVLILNANDNIYSQIRLERQ